MSKDDILELLDAIASTILMLGLAWFSGHYALLITSADIPEAAQRHTDMIVGALIGLLGVFSKVILDAFTKKKGS